MSTSGGSAGLASPLTTKGDVWGYTSTNARIPVGSDTQVLTADSTQPLGLKWAAAAGGVTFPLTNSADEGFQPNSVANNTLNLHNNASAVNGLQITGAATGLAPLLAAIGSDTNIGLNINPKGTGGVNIGGQATTAVPLIVQGSAAGQTADLLDLYQNGAGNLLFKFSTVASAVNGLTFSASGTGGAVQVIAQGGDTNIPVNIATKGTGIFQIYPANTSVATLQVQSVGSMANGIIISGVTTGNGPTIAPQGTDTNIPLGLQSKGTGTIALQPAGSNALVAFGVASPVNYVSATNSATGTAVALGAGGSDANIDLSIAGKGTGVINYGYASTAISGATPATLATGTGGATGPATAAQNAWLAVKINGTVSYIPFWR